MPKTLTITLDEQIYEGLHLIIGQHLETAYRQMALDESRETEALEWAQATCGDVQDETR